MESREPLLSMTPGFHCRLQFAAVLDTLSVVFKQLGSQFLSQPETRLCSNIHLHNGAVPHLMARTERKMDCE